MTATATPTFDLVDAIMRYEAGEMDDAETLDLFAHLITTGQAWQLQGHYGRGATYLIDNGLIYVDPETGVATVNTYGAEED